MVVSIFGKLILIAFVGSKMVYGNSGTSKICGFIRQIIR
jgi:hypothetical protein